MMNGRFRRILPVWALLLCSPALLRAQTGPVQCPNELTATAAREKIAPGESSSFSVTGTLKDETFVPLVYSTVPPASVMIGVPAPPPDPGEPPPGGGIQIGTGHTHVGVVLACASFSLNVPIAPTRLDVGKRFEVGGAIFTTGEVNGIVAAIQGQLDLLALVDAQYEAVRTQMLIDEGKSLQPAAQAQERIARVHASFEQLLISKIESQLPPKTAKGGVKPPPKVSETDLDRWLAIEERAIWPARESADKLEQAQISSLLRRQRQLFQLELVRLSILELMKEMLQQGESLDAARMDVLEVKMTRAPLAFLPKGGTEANQVSLTTHIIPFWESGQIGFTLASVSTERGICLNAPLPPPPFENNPDGVPDYVIQSGSGLPQASQARVVIRSEDYGGFGQVRSSATVGTDTFTAQIFGGSEPTSSLPRDYSPKDDIADGWGGEGPTTASADEDFEDFPSPAFNNLVMELDHGPGSIGDGLTRYEEYRGFFVRGRHVRTYPDRVKDLFVYDRDALLDRSSFRAASQLYVHSVTRQEVKLGMNAKDDFDRPALANPNNPQVSCNQHSHPRRAGRAGQHALYLVADDLEFEPLLLGRTQSKIGTTSTAAGEPEGWPAQILCTAISETNIRNRMARFYRVVFGISEMQAVNDKEIRFPEVFSNTITHEMGHGIGLEHHHAILYGRWGGDERCAMRYSDRELNFSPTEAAWKSARWGQEFCGRTWTTKAGEAMTGDNCQDQREVGDR